MVKIVSKDINKDLGSYIGKKRAMEKGSLFSFKIPKGKKSKPVEKPQSNGEEQVQVEYKQPGLLSKLFSFRRGLINETEKREELTPQEMAKLKGMEDDIEETEKEIVEKEDEVKDIKQKEEVLVQKREGMLTNFFGKMNVFKRRQMEPSESKEEEYVKEEPVLDQDVVEVIKISHKWLGELTPGKKRSFKASSDFQKYKEVLQKYGLVKEKKEE